MTELDALRQDFVNAIYHQGAMCFGACDFLFLCGVKTEKEYLDLMSNKTIDELIVFIKGIADKMNHMESIFGYGEKIKIIIDKVKELEKELDNQPTDKAEKS